MSSTKTALVAVLSEAHNDPRVRRQIDWLVGAGWVVDTIGLGKLPSADVRDHFELTDQARWVRTKLGALVVYGLLPRLVKFRLLVGDRIPPAAKRRIAEGNYDLLIFDEFDFAPIVKDPRVFTSTARRTHLHLDIHEYHEPRLKRVTLWRYLTSGYYKWIRSLIGDPVFATRSTVASRIADFYVEDFAIEKPALVRNSQPFFDQLPSAVDPQNIKLVFHGLASRARGLHDIVDAMRLLDDRFSATFMLTGNPPMISDLREYARDLGSRVQIVPPVPMQEISPEINQYDLEIMFYRPLGRNLEFALPNKFFEAVQGRLGLVIGESPMMAELVKEYANGIIVEGWSPADLAAAINELNAGRVAELKLASDQAARVLNAEAEGAVFLNTIEAARLGPTINPT